MKRPDTIIIASANEHKIAEMKKAFEDYGVTVQSLKDHSNVGPINENGTTFKENAEIKARAVMAATGKPVVADDTGLVVPALNGEPGIRSARYAGDHDDNANNEKLLRELQGKSDRSAYFTTELVYLTPEGEEVTAEGRINGTILTARQGDNQFGYDPLFYVPEKQMTLAEMTIEEKNSISHRGRAVTQLVGKLSEMWQ
ncbi:XTP/dITP diphosphatase [Lentilactobacillus sp. Marseille-Q4993]|uniref:XTP/dITP diphosphatase n=1 Tax=Lentilactobacillus sp. Marseille-Q4993 TaxID=3039492 RepID=UPI0024BCCD43|nr:XTP/dITP diphosphatase [Lentilactobacillus sp. Marseille-Q4993]